MSQPRTVGWLTSMASFADRTWSCGKDTRWPRDQENRAVGGQADPKLDSTRRVRLFFVVGRIRLCGGKAGGNWSPSRRGEGAAEGTGDRWELCRQRRLGVFPLVLARLVEGLSTHQCAGCPRRLRTAATGTKCHRAPVGCPSDRGPNADRPFDEPATSTARRVAAATLFGVNYFCRRIASQFLLPSGCRCLTILATQRGAISAAG